jgi:hypothetical protein
VECQPKIECLKGNPLKNDKRIGMRRRRKHGKMKRANETTKGKGKKIARS